MILPPDATAVAACETLAAAAHEVLAKFREISAKIQRRAGAWRRIGNSLLPRLVSTREPDSFGVTAR
jgi:hypothetical protein